MAKCGQTNMYVNHWLVFFLWSEELLNCKPPLCRVPWHVADLVLISKHLDLGSPLLNSSIWEPPWPQVAWERWRSLNTSSTPSSIWHHTGLSTSCLTRMVPRVFSVHWKRGVSGPDYLCYVLLWFGWRPPVDNGHMTGALLFINCKLPIVFINKYEFLYCT